MKDKLNRYYDQILKLLPCSRKEKAAFLERFQREVDAFVSEQPCPDMDAVIRHFGTPRTVADGFVEQMDIQELASAYRVTRKLLVKVLVTVAVCTAVWVAGIFLVLLLS